MRRWLLVLAAAQLLGMASQAHAGPLFFTLTDPSGRTTSYAYDAANQVSSIRYSDGRTPNGFMVKQPGGSVNGRLVGKGAKRP